MRSPAALLLAASVLLVSAAVFAQSNSNVAYQNVLLGRELSHDDAVYCAAKAATKDEMDSCKVTRLLLADGNNAQGYPPLANIKYTGKTERSQLLDLMTKYGG